MGTTVIKNAAWVIAWDDAAGRHVYRRDIDVAFTDDRIAFLGRDYGGPADTIIDGTERCVIPGLLDIHSHLMLTQPSDKPNLSPGPLGSDASISQAETMFEFRELYSSHVNSRLCFSPILNFLRKLWSQSSTQGKRPT